MIEYVSRLPAGYQEVEYIESNGSQYIDTDFIPNQDTRIVMNALFTIQGTNQFLFGSRAAAKSKTYAFNCYNTKYRSHYNAGYLDYATSVSYTTPFVLDKNKNVTTLNNEHTVTEAYAPFTCPYSLILFGINDGGTINASAKARLYSCLIYNNVTLARDLVPCYRKTDDVVGLYDLVSGAFFGNAGTGSFVAGPDVGGSITVTPGGVIPIKYALRRRMMVSGGGLALPPVGTPLANWTWEEIIALANSGQDPRNYFAVGDEKDLILTTGEVVPTVIGDFYHNTITGTNTKAPIAFTFKNCLNTKYAMNDSRINAGGWDGSNMRKTHMVNIFNTFPAELRAYGAVKYVNVVATAGSKSTSLVTSFDRLRPHSITELGLTYSYAGKEGTKYAYYASGNRVKTVNGAAFYYFTRSPCTNYNQYFCIVNLSGAAEYANADSAFGVACGFDI